MLGFGRSDVLALLGEVAHDCLVGVGTILGRIGVGEALEGVAVAGFDGVQPGLFAWKAKTGVVKTNQGANAGQIKAARIEGSPRSSGSQSNSLGCTVEVVNRAGRPGGVGGEDFLTGMWQARVQSNIWSCHRDREWVTAICCALIRMGPPPGRAIFVFVMGRKIKYDPLAQGCMLALRGRGLP